MSKSGGTKSGVPSDKLFEAPPAQGKLNPILMSLNKTIHRVSRAPRQGIPASSCRTVNKDCSMAVVGKTAVPV